MVRLKNGLYADSKHFTCSLSFGYLGTPLAQMVECRTLDRKVAGSNLTRGAVFFLEQ